MVAHMIPADRILIDADTGWLVIDGIVDEAWYQALNRPCETCLPDKPGWRLSGGNEWKLPDGRFVWHCDCIDGRHTFNIEVEKPRWGEPEPTQGSPLMSRPLLHTTTFRVAIMEILPIREWQSVLDPPTGRWLALNKVDGDRYSIQECDGYGITTTPSNITLPSAAAPGMFAVKLAVRSC